MMEIFLLPDLATWDMLRRSYAWAGEKKTSFQLNNRDCGTWIDPGLESEIFYTYASMIIFQVEAIIC